MSTQIYDFDNLLMQDDSCFSKDSYFYELEQSAKQSPRHTRQEPTKQKTITRPTETESERLRRILDENREPCVM